MLEYAPHNLLLQSQTFDNASWLTASLSVTANAASAPDGTVTADKLIAAASTDFHYIYQSVTTPTGCTVSVYMKSGEYTSGSIFLSQGGNNGAIFNLTTGVVTSVSGAGNTASITSVGNGWYRCSVTNSGDPSDLIRIAPQNGALDSFTGDGTSGIYIWGAQLAVGPYALDYVPTTSAAVYGPRFDYDGSGVTIVEPVSRNLVTYSEDFGNAAWNKFNATVSTNTTISPDGQTTADTLTEDTSVGQHFTNQQTSKTATNIQYTFSAYVKRGTSGTRNVSLAITDGVTGGYEAVFDPDDGAILVAARGIASTTGWTAGAATATNAGNGWWRFAFTVTTNTSTRADGILYLDDGTTNSYTGNGSSNLFVWGAQLELGSTATAYMVSGASNGFRAVPVVSGSATPKGLLVEEQRQNLLTYSEDLSNAAWGKTRGSVTANAAASPDGTVNADAFIEDTGTGDHYLDRSASVSSGAVYTFSIFAKSNGRNWLAVALTGATASGSSFFDLANGVLGTVVANASATITNVGNGWYRCTITVTTNSTTLNIYPVIGFSNGTVSYTGNGTSGLYLWGAQLEAGSFATSYIPTLASAVTRSADVASVNTLSPWYSSTESTIFAEYDTVGSTNNRVFIFDDTGAASYQNYVALSAETTQISIAINVSGSTQAQPTVNIAGSGTQKAAGGWKANDFGLSANGGSVATDTSGTIPTLNKAYLGYYRDGTYLNGHLRRLAYYPRKLSSAELQALSA